MTLLLKSAAALTLSLSLGGCAILGALGGGNGKNAPTLYRFGGETTMGAPLAASAPTIQLNSLRFDPAAEGDRILSITGAEAAYLSRTRWVAPAQARVPPNKDSVAVAAPKPIRCRLLMSISASPSPAD